MKTSDIITQLDALKYDEEVGDFKNTPKTDYYTLNSSQRKLIDETIKKIKKLKKENKKLEKENKKLKSMVWGDKIPEDCEKERD